MPRPIAKSRRPKLIGLAGHMPPLNHHPDKPLPFDPARSEVLDWIATQTPLLLHLFNELNQAKAIVFDPATGLWKGAGQ